MFLGFGSCWWVIDFVFGWFLSWVCRVVVGVFGFVGCCGFFVY